MSLSDFEDFKAIIWEMKTSINSVSSVLYTPLHMLQEISPSFSKDDQYNHILDTIKEMETTLQKLLQLSKTKRETLQAKNVS